MTRRSMGLVLAVLLAAGGAVALVTYARTSGDKPDEALTAVLVVEAAISAGTEGSDLGDLVATQQIPAGERVAGAVSSLNELDGLTASVDIAPGEQLTASQFDAADTAAAAAAAKQAPDGWLMVSVELDTVRSLSGSLRAGDSVAVVGSFNPFEEGAEDEVPAPAADAPDQPAVIAAVDETIDSPTASGYVARRAVVVDIVSVKPPPDSEEWATATQQVTLALPPDDVEQVVFAAEFGTIWLALDSPSSAESSAGPQTRDSIFADDSERPTTVETGS